MTPEAQLVAIAGTQGWKPEVRKRYAGNDNVKGWGINQHLPLGHADRDFTQSYIFLPDYLNDLNAMHEAEKLLFPSRMHTYTRYLRDGAEGTFEWHRIHSTAAQRAEAFLRTLNLWKD